MESVQISVTLVFRENSKKSPGDQLRKFNETMEAGSWQLVENPEVESSGTSATTALSLWYREFKSGKKQKQMVKSARNLVQRATEYADILRLEADIAVSGGSPEHFTVGSEHSSDYFKTKSWK